MHKNYQHITLIGFKNVGKSTIGKNLAQELSLPFIDTDEQVEIYYKNTFNQELSCRKISEQHGIGYFRELEKNVIKDLRHQSYSVIALGGGAPMNSEIHQIIKSHLLIHITAPKSTVFRRIIAKGHPAFIATNTNLYDELEQLWIVREKCYKDLTNITIMNDDSVTNVINKIITIIKLGSP